MTPTQFLKALKALEIVRIRAADKEFIRYKLGKPLAEQAKLEKVRLAWLAQAITLQEWIDSH